MHFVLLRLMLAAIAVVSLGVALFGLFRFLIEVGESPLHFVVQDVGVFAAGVMGMALAWRQSRKLVAKSAADAPYARPFVGYSFQASAQPWKQVLALVFFGLMAAFTVWLYFEEGGWEVGGLAVACVVVFLLMIPMVASHYREGRPTLHMDSRGLEHAWLGEVPWTAVNGLFHKTRTHRGITVHSLVLNVSDPRTYVARMPWIVRLMSGHASLPRARYGDLAIPLNPLDQAPLAVVNAAQALRERASPPGMPSWQPELDEEWIAIGLESEYLDQNPQGLSEHELKLRMEALQLRLQAMTDRLERH